MGTDPLSMAPITATPPTAEAVESRAATVDEGPPITPLRTVINVNSTEQPETPPAGPAASALPPTSALHANSTTATLADGTRVYFARINSNRVPITPTDGRRAEAAATFPPNRRIHGTLRMHNGVTNHNGFARFAGPTRIHEAPTRTRDRSARRMPPRELEYNTRFEQIRITNTPDNCTSEAFFDIVASMDADFDEAADNLSSFVRNRNRVEDAD